MTVKELKAVRMKRYMGLNIQALKDMLKKEVGSQGTLIMKGKSSGRGRKGLRRRKMNRKEANMERKLRTDPERVQP